MGFLNQIILICALIAFTASVSSAFAQSAPQDRIAILIQTLQAQSAALEGANRLCRMDLDTANSELARLKEAEKK